MKTDRLALIAALCGGNLTHSVSAAPSEIAEEVKLAKSHDDEQSTLDEGDNVTLISPLLAERVNEVNSKHGDESLELSEVERREVGPLVRFRMQPQGNQDDESPVPEVIDYEGLAKWANEVAAV